MYGENLGNMAGAPYEDGLAETDDDRKWANVLFTLPEGKELYRREEGYGNYNLKRTGDDSYVLDVCTLDYAQIGLRIEKATEKEPIPYNFGAASMREYYENLENEKLAASRNETFDVDKYYLYIGENKFLLCTSFNYRYVPVELLICKSGHMYDPTGPGDINFTMEILCGVSSLDESTGKSSVRRDIDQKVIFDFDIMLYEHTYQFTHLGKVYEG